MLLDGMDGTLRVEYNTRLSVSSSNSADKSSEETEHYLHHLHHNYSIFPVAVMPLMQPDLGVEAFRQGTIDIK